MSGCNYKNKLCVKRIFYIGKFYTIFILSFYSIIININVISNITYFVKLIILCTLIILFVNRKFNISHNYYVVNISIFRAIKLKKDRKKDFNDCLKTIFAFSFFFLSL